MAKLSPEEIARLASDAGFSGQDVETAVAIAMAESKGGDPNEIGDLTIQTASMGPSVGLWQIRSVNPGYGNPFDKAHRNYQANFDPATNAANAYAIYTNPDGKGWREWSTYKNGKYKEFLDRAGFAAGTRPPPLPEKRSDNIPPVPEKRGDAGGNGMSAVLEQLAGSLPQFLQQSNRLGNVARQAQQTVARGGSFGDVPGSRHAEQGNQRNANRSTKQAEGARDRVDKVRDGVKDSGEKYEQYDQDKGQVQQQEGIKIDNAYDAYRNYA
jgi:hypothetical protein